MELAIYIILAVVAIAAIVLAFIYRRSLLLNWILEAVINAEKELGSGKGAEKLKQVHTRVVEKFPIIGRIMPFGLFSTMVDGALDLIKTELEDETKKGE